MATWEQVKDLIKGNFQSIDDEGDLYKSVFDLGNGRTQMVFVQKFETKNKSIWIQIASPVGVIRQDKINKALELINEKACGGLVKIGDKHYVRHCLPIEDLSQEEFAVPLILITSIADELEKVLIGGDQL
jgi:hypothetical protein